MSARSYDVVVAHSLEKVEQLHALWDDVLWAGEQAEHAYFTAAARARAAHGEPYAVIVSAVGAPVAAAVGRIERRRLETSVGYLRLYAPSLRILQVVPGGIVGSAEALPALEETLRVALARGEADALALPALPIDGAIFATFARFGRPLDRQPLIPTWTRQRLVLPASFDAFLASRSAKVRAGVRYDSKKLVEAIGPGLKLELARDASEFERLAGDIERVARTTYQRTLGAGFADTEERRLLLRVALEHGWARLYLLYDDDTPIAFWICSVHGDTITLATTGYLADYARLRPGIYLLMRVIEDACADPSLRVLDFGPGRSSYKRHFSSEGYEERNLLLFAPTFRARRINATRTAILGVSTLARKALDATGTTDRLKTAWRGRLRKAGA